MSRDIFDDSPARERNFASDNNSGVCPEVMEAMQACNRDHAPGYGDDALTRRASGLVQELFETDCETFFVFNGTAANALALASVCRPHNAILCHRLSHVETDECGAPEFFTGGSKVLGLEGEQGRLSAASIEEAATAREDVHFPVPKVVSLTQATELGTVYRMDDLWAVKESCRRLGLKLHLDGARFANAMATLGISASEFVRETGVDALSFGATKNGTAVGDAVVFFDKEVACEFEYRRKQAGQLASKMRYLAAPWLALLTGDLWLRNAAQANQMAERLAAGLKALPGLEVLFPREANSVFAELPEEVKAALFAKGWKFYPFVREGVYRFMCSWDTTEADVDAFLADLAGELSRLPSGASAS